MIYERKRMKQRIREEKKEDLLGALRERGPELEKVHREKRSAKRRAKDLRMRKVKGNG